MKESFSGIQLFIIVVTIVLLFSGIMALTINHANAFAVKDQLVQIIEENESFDMDASCESKDKCNDDTLKKMIDSLQHNSYRQSGKCNTYSVQKDKIRISSYQRDGRPAKRDSAALCIYRIKEKNDIDSYIYRVEVFYNLDIPILKSVFNLKAVGETKRLYS